MLNIKKVNNMLTPKQEKKRLFEINKIDVLYRDIENFDEQFEVMHNILNCFKTFICFSELYNMFNKPILIIKV